MRKPLAILSILSMTMLFAACNTAPVDEETDTTDDVEMTDEMEPVMTEDEAEMSDDEMTDDEASDEEMTDEVQA